MTGMVHWSSRGKVANRSFRRPSDFPSDIHSRRNAGRIVKYFHKNSIQNVIWLCSHFSLTSTATHVPCSRASQRCNANETSRKENDNYILSRIVRISWPFRHKQHPILPTFPSDLLPPTFRHCGIFESTRFPSDFLPQSHHFQRCTMENLNRTLIA